VDATAAFVVVLRAVAVPPAFWSVGQRRRHPRKQSKSKQEQPAMGSIKKKRRAKMSKHKHDKRIKLERHKTR
jgi:hypothetical protein